MTPVIRVDDQVMDELKKRAIGLGLVFEPPNATLRRVLGLDTAVMDAKDMKAVADGIVSKVLEQAAKTKNMIELKLNASSREYVYIPLPKDKRHFFPGFKVDFQLETDVRTLTAHVTSQANGASVEVGNPHAGTHIRGKFGRWFAKHPELKAGDRLRIEALEPGKRYKLSVVSAELEPEMENVPEQPVKPKPSPAFDTHKWVEDFLKRQKNGA
ncbi:MAG: hypothetical protein HY665_03060 [Chloroflexi bacterium]|nr:hypothetical protein [Chloroflexota bacterium]